MNKKICDVCGKDIFNLFNDSLFIGRQYFTNDGHEIKQQFDICDAVCGMKFFERWNKRA